jgi:LmbE family N-acetylglucosaminyl deacetylase
MRVLAVGAHPDDLEILCAGTLARFVMEGHYVLMAHACRGDKGHGQIPPEELGEVRYREAQAAAAVVGAEALALGFPDCELYVGDASTRCFVDLIRRAQPDLIITHHPDDYHGDHRAVSKLVVDASFAAGLSYYVTELPAVAVTPSVYFMDTLAGIDFTPKEYVDITATIEVKLAAMRSHQSQVTWIREHHASDIEDLIRTVAHFRGLQCGARYAEGFQRLRAWGRLGTSRELP